jgi:hypothetical protein
MSRPTDPYGWQSWAWDAIERAGDDLPGLAGLVLLLLAQHGNADGRAHPSARTLGRYLGRTDKPVRRALALLAQRDLIVADGSHRRATIWRLAATADPGSAPDRTPTADPLSAVVRPDCGPTADGVRTPVSAEGEVEEKPSLTLNGSKGRRESESDDVIDITTRLARGLRSPTRHIRDVERGAGA